MRIDVHPLLPATPACRRELHSLHFGPGGGRKALIQCSLHADEPPGMLVGYHLRRALAALEAAGRLLAEVVLVPLANPLGLSQRLLGRGLGRFELDSGENFNRRYADLSGEVHALLKPRLKAGDCPPVAEVRALLRERCLAQPAGSELASLRRALLGLAIDAELVLDLHCDSEAVMHLYTVPTSWPHVESLARCLRADLCLLAEESGGEPFDEACSLAWSRLNQLARADLGVEADPWPDACVAVTVELRGEADVEHALAEADAAGLLAWLQQQGWIAGPTQAVPEWRCEPRPLQGSLPLRAPLGGVLVHRAALGSEVRKGDLLCEILDPLAGELHPLLSPCDGLLYARAQERVVHAGCLVAKVAGREAVRTGALLSA